MYETALLTPWTSAKRQKPKPRYKSLSAYPKMTLYFDEIRVGQPSPASATDVSCWKLSLRRATMPRRRIVHVMEIPAIEAAGTHSMVGSTIIFSPCRSPQIAWRKQIRPGMAYPTQDVTNALIMSDEGIGPAIFAISENSMLMSHYDMSLDTFLVQVDETRVDWADLIRQLWRLCYALASINFTHTDLKPPNVVLKVKVDESSGAVHVTDMRLIDFDAELCMTTNARASGRFQEVTFIMFLQIAMTYYVGGPRPTKNIFVNACIEWARIQSQGMDLSVVQFLCVNVFDFTHKHYLGGVLTLGKIDEFLRLTL